MFSNPDYGYADLLNGEEAVEYVADLIVRGHNTTEINRALNEFFPGVDYITCGKIARKAIKFIRDNAENTEKKWYILKSIHRLERLMSNPHEKTRNILAADAQLTHLLGLANLSTVEDPEDLAAKIRSFLNAADAVTAGEEVKDESSTEKQKTGEKVSKETKAENEITKEEELQLKIARAKRLKEQIKNEETA